MPEAFRADPVTTFFSFGEKVSTCPTVLRFLAVALFYITFYFHLCALFLRVERLLDCIRKFFAAILTITNNIVEKAFYYIGNRSIYTSLFITPGHSRNSISSCLSSGAILPIVLIPNWQAHSARRNRCPMF